MARAQERLGKEVGRVFGGWNMDYVDITILNMFTNIMMLNVNVFSVCVSFSILGKRLSGGVVDMN